MEFIEGDYEIMKGKRRIGLGAEMAGIFSPLLQKPLS